LEVGGVSNVLSKSLGSSNKTNTAYATIAALKLVVPAKHWVTNITGPPAKQTSSRLTKVSAKAHLPVKKRSASTKKDLKT